MKNLLTVGLLVACLVASPCIFAQQPVSKPTGIDKTFVIAQLPKKIECTFPALQKIPNARVADNISMQMGDVQFTGQVVEKVQHAANLLSMNVRSTNFAGAFCTISVITEADHTQKLVGRIFNPQSDEVLVLTEENNRYFWVKQPRQFLLTE